MATNIEETETTLAAAERLRTDGNELLNKGDFADACDRYDAGLLALVRVAEEHASPTRLALHLNAALAHLRRGNLASAVDHANGAIAIDPQNVKAIYRRGMARARLSENVGHEAESALAIADLQQALELEPGNTEVRTQLQKLRNTVRAEQKEFHEIQKNTFRSFFSSGKRIYEEPARVDPKFVIRDCGDGDHKLMLCARNVAFEYGPDGSEQPGHSAWVLRGVTIELRAGWCYGLLGINASGKTTLARLLTGILSPQTGEITHHGQVQEDEPASPWASIATSACATIGMALFAVACGVVLDQQKMKKLAEQLLWWHWASLVALMAAVLLVIYMLLERRSTKQNQHSVLLVTSDSQEKEDIPSWQSIETVIGEVLPRQLSKADRRAKVVAILRASGFQMYNQETNEPQGSAEDYVKDGLKYGVLSGGQRHLIYILRCFAMKPAVMICDELLGGLDFKRQPRVLHMLRRMKNEVGTAILFITTEINQLRIAADSVGFLAEGRICETGRTDIVLEIPTHQSVKDYVVSYKALTYGKTTGNKLAENYSGLKDDKDLAGPWLP